MNLIIVPRSGSRLYSLRFRGMGQIALVALSTLFLISILIGSGYWLGLKYGHESLVHQWKEDVVEQQVKLEKVKRVSEAHIEALTKKISFFQAHINRLDALGNKLATMAKVDEAQFDFRNQPGFGGPIIAEAQSNDDLSESVESVLQTIAVELESREKQLLVLDQMLTKHNLRAEVHPTGRPVAKGWVSSYFGKRRGPFSGKQEFHRGIDIAGKRGSDIIAVAGGVVVSAKDRYGYGNMIEIDHGNGYATRYGHNDDMLVSAGQAVKKGQVIAKMGSTGKSTGPHVHFEVMKNGVQVDPSKYIRSAKK